MKLYFFIQIQEVIKHFEMLFMWSFLFLNLKFYLVEITDAI